MRDTRTWSTNLEEAFDTHCTNGKLDGEVVFQLHDTFGFPLDLTRLIAAERSITLDETGYANKMEEHRAMGRANWKGSGDSDKARSPLADLNLSTKFLGYTENNATSTVVALLDEAGGLVKTLHGKGSVILDQTPLWREWWTSWRHRVLKSQQRNHRCHRYEETLDKTRSPSRYRKDTNSYRHVQRPLSMYSLAYSLDAIIPRPICSTQLCAKCWGHCRESKGSLVTPTRLRFDFSHHKPVTDDETSDTIAGSTRDRSKPSVECESMLYG